MAERDVDRLKVKYLSNHSGYEYRGSQVNESLTGAKMDSHFEKYLDARFAGIDQHFAHIDSAVTEMRSDMREIRGDIKELRKETGEKIDKLKYWIIGAVLTLATLFFAVVGCHAMVMQTQLAVFSDYVKAVTQPYVPSPPPANTP